MNSASQTIIALLAIGLTTRALPAQAPFPRIQANDNRVPAGVLEDGVLRLQLDVVRGMWHPDRDDDPGIDVLAFAEAGLAPSIPGPLIRVPRGTEIRTTLHNALTDSAIIVYGLSGERAPADTVVIQPGATRDLVTRANVSGTFMYMATTKVRPQREGDDRMLVGGFVVDEPGAIINDRVLVIFQFMTTPRLGPSPFVGEILTINGKSWPNTERLSYSMGDTIRWRVINGSHDVHPMHLHGAYFTVLSRGDPGNDTLYSAQQRRQVVTERLLPLTTMMMQWTPAHAGNWVFHCHLTFHIMAHPPLGPMKASMDDHAMQSMGGLVIGTMVSGRVAPDARARRNIRLIVQQYDSVPGETGPPFSYHFDRESNTPAVPAPPIIVTRGQPIAITVVNRALEPTAVHWHGLEIESFYDGVHGFGGHGNVIAPHIEPNDSFIARMTPPRAGTFIYHTHFDEARQQSGGLYGAFVVLEPGKTWDAEHDRIILLGSKRDTLDTPLINGREDAVIRFKAGESYRLRLINITLARPNIFVSLMDGDTPLEWNPVARDGADLPSYQTGLRPAKLQNTIGQTYDLLFQAPAAGEYALELRTGNGQLLTRAKVLVE